MPQSTNSSTPSIATTHCSNNFRQFFFLILRFSRLQLDESIRICIDIGVSGIPRRFIHGQHKKYARLGGITPYRRRKEESNRIAA